MCSTTNITATASASAISIATASWTSWPARTSTKDRTSYRKSTSSIPRRNFPRNPRRQIRCSATSTISMAMAGRTSSCWVACISTRRIGTKTRRARKGRGKSISSSSASKANRPRSWTWTATASRSWSRSGKTSGGSFSRIGSIPMNRGISNPSPRRATGSNFGTVPASAT